MSAIPVPLAWPEAEYGLYLHWPFCPYRCHYCDFAVVVEPAGAPSRSGRYLAALLREWAAKPLPPPGTRLVSVYFGGGTPSLLDPAGVERLLDAVAERTGASPADWEVSLEANPGTLSPQRLAAYRAAGVNRLSLGVQTLDDRRLQAIGRGHTVAQAAQAVAWARAAGFANLNVDAIYGLPGQSRDDWAATVDGLLAWQPEHVSLYQLQVEEGTRLARDLRLGRRQLPDEDAVAEMGELAQARLAAAGYRRYEISNFARPGFECRHNRLYWRLSGYLALGMAAHAYWPGGAGRPGRRVWNHRGLARYLAAVEAGEDPAAGFEELPWEEETRQFVWLGLRQVAGISPRRFQRRFGVSLQARFGSVAAELVAAGLLELTAERWRLTPRGLELANRVALALLDA